MPQARVGWAGWHGNHWDIRITLPDGSRSNRACLPVGMSETDARAEARRLTLQSEAEGWEKIPAPTHARATGNTFDVYAERWLATRRDPKDASAHLRFHILPLLIDHVTTSITREDVARVVARLDERVRAGEISWKTAWNVWATVSKLFDDAANSKRLELRVLAHNPADGVRGPDRGDQRQSAYLFPNEAAKLLACEAVPRGARVMYTLALYMGVRRGELVELLVEDVVLEGGYVNVHQAHDRVSGGTKSTKGRRARRVPIEPALRPLLEALVRGPDVQRIHTREGSERLVSLPANEKTSTRARAMRQHLELAGLKRAELLADDDNRRPLVFHDLRHTFATWLAIAGENELTIQTRLGHASTEMTQKYITEAEAVGRGDIGEPFGALPASLVGPLPPAPETKSPGRVPESRKPMKSRAGHGIRTRDIQLGKLALYQLS